MFIDIIVDNLSLKVLSDFAIQFMGMSVLQYLQLHFFQIFMKWMKYLWKGYKTVINLPMANGELKITQNNINLLSCQYNTCNAFMSVYTDSVVTFICFCLLFNRRNYLKIRKEKVWVKTSSLGKNLAMFCFCFCFGILFAWNAKCFVIACALVFLVFLSSVSGSFLTYVSGF